MASTGTALAKARGPTLQCSGSMHSQIEELVKSGKAQEFLAAVREEIPDDECLAVMRYLTLCRATKRLSKPELPEDLAYHLALIVVEAALRHGTTPEDIMEQTINSGNASVLLPGEALDLDQVYHEFAAKTLLPQPAPAPALAKAKQR